MMMFLLKNINSCYGNNKLNIPNVYYITIKNKFYIWIKLSIFKNYNNSCYNNNQLYIDVVSIYNKKGH